MKSFPVLQKVRKGVCSVIEKMKFISISGPKDDLDRMVNQSLSHYEIQLENTLTELKSAAKLSPYPGNNPYKEPFAKAQRLITRYENTNLYESRNQSIEEALETIEQTDSHLLEISQKREELTAKLKDIHALLELVKLFQELDFNIPVILKFEHLKYRFGRIQKELYSQLEEFADHSRDTILCKCHESDHYISLLYFVPAVISERIDAVFSSMQFERIFLPDQYDGTPQEEISKLEKQIEDLKLEIKELDQKESVFLNGRKDSVLLACRVLESYHSNFNVRKYAACTHDKEHPFYILCGWVPADQAEKLRAELERDKNTFFVIEDNNEHLNSMPPTKLKNPSLFRPFEMFVRMYGLPAYNEFDPTLLIAVTYSIFFGFMFGDVGQGLLLLIGGLLLYRFKKMDLAAIVACCGFFSTIFGTLFGSVFGFEDVIPALWLKPTEAMTDLPFVGRLNTVFVVAIAAGMGIILFTMILNMISSFRTCDTEKTWFDTNGLAGFIFYLSLAVTVVLYMSGKPLPATVVLVIMFVIPLLLVFFKEPLTAIVEKRSEKISGTPGMFFVQGFFELFEVLLSYFSNTLSFVRVGAFAVSHAAMMEVVLMLGGAETGNLSIPVIVLGNLFVCGMEGLIVGIQVLRLEYYELFSRFYKGSGREFKPFYKSTIGGHQS